MAARLLEIPHGATAGKRQDPFGDGRVLVELEQGLALDAPEPRVDAFDQAEGLDVVAPLQLLDDAQLLLEEIGLQQAPVPAPLENEVQQPPFVEVMLDGVGEVTRGRTDEGVQIGVRLQPEQDG
jgi:hypothetical protein